MTIFAEMVEYMADPKWLIDTAEPGVMDELCQCFAGFFQYARSSAASPLKSSVAPLPCRTRHRRASFMRAVAPGASCSRNQTGREHAASDAVFTAWSATPSIPGQCWVPA